MTPIERLEQYALRHPQEVLLVSAQVAGVADEVTIFRGFSSSLSRATAFDPDVPILPAEATIAAIARIRAPYQPDNPQYLERDIAWEDMDRRLQAMGL